MENYTIYRSRRRSVALEITRDCRVVVRVPMHCPRAAIDVFVGRHADWIAENLERQRLRQLAAPPAPSPAEIAALKARAREILPPKVQRYGAIMGLSPTGIRITTARTRFGSCSGKNSLCFSCFLINYPEAAIDLVVVHELCHIRVKNHGPAFYTLLGSVLPDYRERRALLREPRLPE